MTVTFAGQQCLSPQTIYRQCVELALDLSWYGRPNSLACPLGTKAGEGWVLLTRGQLSAIDSALRFTGLYDLQFSITTDAGPSQVVTVKQLLVTACDCITPGARGDPAAAYLVAVADRRRIMDRFPIDAAYNMRQVSTQAWLPATLNQGQPWTWDQVLKDVWTRINPLPAYPGLPKGFTPDGTPEDLEFWGDSALAALAKVLRRLGCALRWDPLADQYSIVQVGADDPAATAALNRWDSWRHWDTDPLFSVRATIPQQVRVLFRKLPFIRGSGSPYYAINVIDPTKNNTDGEELYSVADIHDDLNALMHGTVATPTNQAALQTRANQRAADWFRQQWVLAKRLRRIYALPLADPALLPGSQIRSIRWADVAGGLRPGQGMVTEVVRVGEVADQLYPDEGTEQQQQTTLTVVTCVQPVKSTISGSSLVTDVVVETTPVTFTGTAGGITCTTSPAACCPRPAPLCCPPGQNLPGCVKASFSGGTHDPAFDGASAACLDGQCIVMTFAYFPPSIPYPSYVGNTPGLKACGETVGDSPFECLNWNLYCNENLWGVVAQCCNQGCFNLLPGASATITGCAPFAGSATVTIHGCGISGTTTITFSPGPSPCPAPCFNCNPGGCPGCGGGGGGGGGGGIITPCCPAGLPSTLYAYFPDGSVIPIIWNGTNWNGGSPACGLTGITLQLACGAAGTDCHGFTLHYNAGGGQNGTLSVSACDCSVPSLAFLYGGPGALGRCGGPGFTITVLGT